MTSPTNGGRNGGRKRPRRSIAEIMAAKQEREKLQVGEVAAVADHDLLWEAVTTVSMDVLDVKDTISDIAGDLRFIARIFRVLAVAAPTLAAVAAFLSYTGII